METKLKDKYNSILNKKIRTAIRQKMIETFGLSKITIANWLCGRVTPTPRYWNAIAEIFGVPVEELFPKN